MSVMESPMFVCERNQCADNKTRRAHRQRRRTVTTLRDDVTVDGHALVAADGQFRDGRRQTLPLVGSLALSAGVSSSVRYLCLSQSLGIGTTFNPPDSPK